MGHDTPMLHHEPHCIPKTAACASLCAENLEARGTFRSNNNSALSWGMCRHVLSYIAGLPRLRLLALSGHNTADPLLNVTDVLLRQDQRQSRQPHQQSNVA